MVEPVPQVPVVVVPERSAFDEESDIDSILQR